MNLTQEPRISPGRVRSGDPERPPVILEQWRYSRTAEQLVGYVYNHPNPQVTDGKRVRTSRLVWVREDVGLAQTLNTLYVLRDRAG